MADTSDFITGCDGSEIDGCEEPWCLDDGPPPGYELIPEYPVVPPNPISCTVVDRASYYFNMIHQFPNGMYYWAQGGTSVAHYLFNADHTQVGLIYSGTSRTTACIEGEYIYIVISYILIRRMHIVTGVVENISPPSGIDFGNCYRISSYQGLIVIGADNFEVNGTTYAGALILNTLGEFVDVIGETYYYGSTIQSQVLSNGVLLRLRYAGEGEAIKLYNVLTGDYLGDLPKPTDTYTNKGYGNHVVDLGVVEGEGRFAVLNGGYATNNSAGFVSSVNYYQVKNKVALYDYNFNLLVDLESPILPGVNNTLFGAGIARHGHYIVIGEARVGTYQGISQPGATHLYDDNGNFIKTLNNWDVAKPDTDSYMGGGLTFSAESIKSWASAIVAVYADSRECLLA